MTTTQGQVEEVPDAVVKEEVDSDANAEKETEVDSDPGDAVVEKETEDDAEISKKAKGNKCPQCDRTLRNVHSLQRHIREGVCRLACTHCPFRTGDRKSLVAHVRVTHPEHLEEMLAENEVDEDPMETYRKELKKQRSGFCEICQATKVSLRSHMKTVHSKGPFQCKKCSEVFTTWGRLQVHMRRDHRGLPTGPFTCPLCFSTFALLQSRTRHLKTGSCRRSCPHCSFVARTEQSLKYHLKKEHKKEKVKASDGKVVPPMSEGEAIRREQLAANRRGFCDICKQEKKNLQVHIREVHKRVEGRFECQICDYVCTLASTLRHHVYSKHRSPGRNAYLCKPCGQTFSRPAALNRHLKSGSCSKRAANDDTIEEPDEDINGTTSNEAHEENPVDAEAGEPTTHDANITIEEEEGGVLGELDPEPIDDGLSREDEAVVDWEDESGVSWETSPIKYSGKAEPQTEKSFGKETEPATKRNPVCPKIKKDKEPAGGDHDGTLFSCPFCRTGFPREASLRRHLEKAECKFKCPHCSMRASSKADVAKHMQVEHRDLLNKLIQKMVVGGEDEEEAEDDGVKDTSYEERDKIQEMEISFHASDEDHNEDNMSSIEGREGVASQGQADAADPIVAVSVEQNETFHHSDIQSRDDREKEDEDVDPIQSNHVDIDLPLSPEHLSTSVFELDYPKDADVTDGVLEQQSEDEAGLAEKEKERSSSDSQSDRAEMCHLCDKSFICLRQHIENMHEKAGELLCEICSEKFPTKTRLRAHMRKHDSGALKQCDHCQQLVKERKLSAHMTKCRKARVCNYCETEFPSIRELHNHKRREHYSIPDKGECDICGAYVNNVTDHKLRVHQKAFARQCDVCSAVVSSQRALKYHMLVKHSDKELAACPTCGTRFPKEALARHEARCSKVRVCNFCDAKFASVNELQNHKRQEHTGGAPQKLRRCDVCDVAVVNLKRHKEVVHEKVEQHQCDRCAAVLMSDRSYAYHVLVKHSDVALQQCKACKMKVRAEEFEAHVAKCTSAEQSCSMCDFTTNIKVELRNHRRKEHPTASLPKKRAESKTYPCDQCDRQFQSRQRLEKHAIKCGSPRRDLAGYCEICDKHLKNIKEHMKKSHDNGGPFSCNKCGDDTTQFDSFAELRKHRREAHPDPPESLVCDACGKAFAQRDSLLQHVRNNRCRFGCHHCDFKAELKVTVSEHIRSEHPDAIDTLCKVRKCHFYAKTSAEVAAHVEAAHKYYEYELLGSQKVPCETCGAQVKGTYMQQHVTNMHEKERNVLCDLCGFAATGKGVLKRHIKSVHGERAFPCPECGFAFRGQWQLMEHVNNVHKKIKNLQCDQCPMTFYHLGMLTSHIKAVHLKVKDHMCHMCDYKASERSDLKKHITRVHIKALDFACETCDFATTNVTALKKHKCRKNLTPASTKPNTGQEEQHAEEPFAQYSVEVSSLGEQKIEGNIIVEEVPSLLDEQ